MVLGYQSLCDRRPDDRDSACSCIASSSVYFLGRRFRDETIKDKEDGFFEDDVLESLRGKAKLFFGVLFLSSAKNKNTVRRYARLRFISKR